MAPDTDAGAAANVESGRTAAKAAACKLQQGVLKR
jgi:hypothetical protein